MPCTGGSPWQSVNEAHYFRTENHRAMRRFRGIRTDFRYLFWNFREIACAVHEAGGRCTALRGCACGLKDSKGNYMKKPWTTATTSHIVAEGLERRCDGTHEHVVARGRECKSAEDYTDDFAKQ
eukprot:300812-Pyramimonas_sp.AAC.1